MDAARPRTPGGIIHTYQSYDPVRLPSPLQEPPDLVSPTFEHLLAYGSFRDLTPEELARAVRIDPSQIAGLGPSLESIIALLLERKRRILETYETGAAIREARKTFRQDASRIQPPDRLKQRFHHSVAQEQLRDLERLWYAVGDDSDPFARQLVPLIEKLGDLYQVETLAAKYDFTGSTPLSVAEALEVKEELEKIDELLKQLKEARENAQIGVIDMEALAEYVEPGDMQNLAALQQLVEDYLREQAQRQGLTNADGRWHLSPASYRLFQGKILARIFSHLQAARTGRHTGPVAGEGAVELQRTKPYEFGDSLSHIDISQSLINAMLRTGSERPIRLRTSDIEIHRTRNTPKCATVVVMDMSGSMRYDGQYINVKRMALALEGLIHSEFPGDYLNFVEMYTFAKLRRPGELVHLLPRPVTIHQSVVRLMADMSRTDISEMHVPQHFTNIQHALQLARRLLAAQDTPNRQIILITDGLPTAHFEEQMLYLLYPAHARTEEATLREGRMCQQQGITLNVFLVPSWSQSEEDIRFAYRLAESTRGRVFFTAGRDLDRFVVWDYVARKREVLGS